MTARPPAWTPRYTLPGSSPSPGAGTGMSTSTGSLGCTCGAPALRSLIGLSHSCAQPTLAVLLPWILQRTTELRQRLVSLPHTSSAAQNRVPERLLHCMN